MHASKLTLMIDLVENVSPSKEFDYHGVKLYISWLWSFCYSINVAYLHLASLKSKTIALHDTPPLEESSR